MKLIRRILLGIGAALLVGGWAMTGYAAGQPAAAPDNDESRWWYPVVTVGVIVGGALMLNYFRRRCPKCNRSWALRKTGETEGKTVEWECKRCAHTTWRKPFERCDTWG